MAQLAFSADNTIVFILQIFSKFVHFYDVFLLFLYLLYNLFAEIHHIGNQKCILKVSKGRMGRGFQGFHGVNFSTKFFFLQKLPKFVQNCFLGVFNAFLGVFGTFFFFCLRYTPFRMHEPHLHTFFVWNIQKKIVLEKQWRSPNETIWITILMFF